MPRGIPNTRVSPFDEVEEQEYSSPSSSDDLAIRAAEDIAASFMRQHPPPEGDRKQLKRHMSYWQFCPDPTCREPGHRERTGFITTDIGTGGPLAGQQVADYANLTHAVNLESILGQPGGWPANSIANNEVGLIWGDFDPAFDKGPWTHLFLAPRGIFLMPIKQFCQLGFHRDPELAKWRRDEIDQMKFYKCDQCPSDAPDFIEEAHLDKHRASMHKDHVAAVINSRETAKVIGEVIQGGNDRVSSAQYNQLVQMYNALSEKLEQVTAKS